MDRKSQIQQRIEETLNSLDNMSRAEPPPFLYTSVQARLLKQDENAWENVSSFITRPAFAFVSVALVIALNAFVVMKFTSGNTVPQDRQEIAIADEYNSTTSPFNYNIDNVQP